MNRLLAAAAAGLTLAGSAAAQTPPPLTVPEPVQTLPGGTDYAAVLASPVRTDEDRARDAARMTEQTLRFTGVQPGWKVGDMIMGGGYFTRAFSAAVGPGGHVVAWQPAEFIGFQASYGEAADAADRLANVDVIRSPIGAPEALPGSISSSPPRTTTTCTSSRSRRTRRRRSTPPSSRPCGRAAGT